MSTVSTGPVVSSPFVPPGIVPPEDGDHLSVEEFIRRWDAMSAAWKAEHRRAELIEGVVRMAPSSGGHHGQPQFNFVTFLGAYAWATPGVFASNAASIILDTKNMPEPDAILAIHPKCRGRIRLDERGFILGAPDLLTEISNSSVSYDLHAKKELYRKFEVTEYVVWRVQEKAIDWFVLRGDDYVALTPTDGIYRSEIFPGLWLAASALIASDFPRVRQVLDEGLNSPEHRAFLETLAKNKSA